VVLDLSNLTNYISPEVLSVLVRESGSDVHMDTIYVHGDAPKHTLVLTGALEHVDDRDVDLVLGLDLEPVLAALRLPMMVRVLDHDPFIACI